jgi:hypothetical protein
VDIFGLRRDLCHRNQRMGSREVLSRPPLRGRLLRPFGMQPERGDGKPVRIRLGSILSICIW